MAADIIPLRLIKTIVVAALESRFAAREKAPAKQFELRVQRSPSRAAERQFDSVAGIRLDVKKVCRPRSAGKLRLFRMFKLLGQLKETTPAAIAPRPIAERLRLARWMRRL